MKKNKVFISAGKIFQEIPDKDVAVAAITISMLADQDMQVLDPNKSMRDNLSSYFETPPTQEQWMMLFNWMLKNGLKLSDDYIQDMKAEAETKAKAASKA